MRWWCLLAFGALSFFAAVSCDSESSGDGDCDRIDRHCRTVCNYGYSCDTPSYWGCCHDQCWYSCTSDGKNKPAEGSTEAPPPSTSTPPPASSSTTDAGPAKGVLCSPCASNEDCQTGAACIQPGGDDAGVGSGSFCGHPCQDSAKDCPVGFSCTQVAGSMQCTPNDNTCD